jgi:hypothetical protein
MSAPSDGATMYYVQVHLTTGKTLIAKWGRYVTRHQAADAWYGQWLLRRKMGHASLGLENEVTVSTDYVVATFVCDGDETMAPVAWPQA